MNPTARKIILEHTQIMKTALSRIHHFNRTQGFNDASMDLISRLNILVSELENHFFNMPDDPPEEHPLIWALRTALKSNREIADEDIAALVRQALKEGWKDGASSATEG